MAGNKQNSPIVFRGVEEICGAVGIPKRQLSNYVKEHGLPAFKIAGKEWIATPEALTQWVKEQSRKSLK